ncbi:MAG: hypothetical protein QF464_08075 [Myxococcota bacterium]|nr:hypothetical protein [Myxococcota bacterium]
MRILTAGFDRARTERLGGILMDAGHAVLSASGSASCRTLAHSVKPDALMVPEGAIGDDAIEWAADLLTDTPVIRLSPEDDPADAIETLTPPRRPSETATEQLSEEAIFAAIEAAPPTPPALPAPGRTPAPVETPRRSATLRSTSAGPLLSDKLHEIRFGDYHAILEVQPGATTYVVRQQYDSLRELYTPTGWHGPLGPADIDSLREIGQGLDDAFAVLGHATYQSRYEAALDAGAASGV